MANKCLRCVTGMIGATKIYEGDWEQSAALFEKKIEDWNERTRMAGDVKALRNEERYRRESIEKLIKIEKKRQSQNKENK